jgi:hypothetical protein
MQGCKMVHSFLTKNFGGPKNGKRFYTHWAYSAAI